MAAPSSGAIRGSVIGGLGIKGNLTPMLVPTVNFYPTLGIAAARIDKLALDIRSFREPLRRSIKRVMVPSIRRNFDEGGRPSWEPLSEFTLALRAKEGTGDKILVRGGKLRRIASQINLWTITPTSAVIRDLPQQIWYGKVHQSGYGGMGPLLLKHGGDIKKATAEFDKKIVKGRTSPNIPARPFLMIHPEDELAIQAVFIEWLAERVVHAWPGARV